MLWNPSPPSQRFCQATALALCHISRLTARALGGNLVLDDAVIAMQRRVGGIADHLAADGERALFLDEDR